MCSESDKSISVLSKSFFLDFHSKVKIKGQQFTATVWTHAKITEDVGDGLKKLLISHAAVQVQVYSKMCQCTVT